MPESTIYDLLPGKPVWQQQIAEAITDPADLLSILDLKPEHFAHAADAHKLFTLKVPKTYINKIEKGNPEDPLLLQIMSKADELINTKGFDKNPVGDLESIVVPGLLHKYQGRALLIASSACAIHCRYCFRRHFPYSENISARDHWQEAIEYIQQHPDIDEIILSGGDPLSLSDQKLSELIQQLDQIPHLKRLRIHTRMPVVLPSRITEHLIDTLHLSRLQVCVVIHANHAQEITQHEILALERLSKAATLLNQSVLLKNVNDSVTVLKELSEKLYRANVLPYYLHMLDPVDGASHFDVDEARAINLMNQLRESLPGYLVPRLVREIPGKNSKVPIIGL